MANLTTDECYNKIKEHYFQDNDCKGIIADLCVCFDSNILNEFVEYLNKEYEDADEES